MLAVPVQKIGDATLVSSNIVEQLPLASAGTTFTTWSGATNFTVGNQVCWVGQFSSAEHPSWVDPNAELAFGVFTALYAGSNLEPGAPVGSGGRLAGWWAWQRDATYAAWVSTATYAKGTFVGQINGASGAVYQSLVDGNLGNSPGSSPTQWRQVGVGYASYAGGTTYASGARVVTFYGTRGLVFDSLQNGNTGHTPESSPTWWQFIGESYKTFDLTATYALGDVVIDLAAHHEYESLAAGNIGHALSDTTKWVDRGATNRMRMFDDSNSAQSSQAESIDVTVQLTGFADVGAVLNIAGSEVEVWAYEGAVQRYHRLIPLPSVGGINDFWLYYFEPIMRPDAALVTDLPMYADMTLRMVVREPGGTARIGTMAAGKARDLGTTLWGLDAGIQSYSRADEDQFGNVVLLKRGNAKINSLKAFIPEGRSEVVQRVLADQEAVPTLYIGSAGDDWRMTWQFGFSKSFKVSRNAKNDDILTLDVQELI